MSSITSFNNNYQKIGNISFLHCNESLDSEESEESDSCTISSISFTDKLVANCFAQITHLHQTQWEQFKSASLPNPMKNRLQTVLQILTSDEIPRAADYDQFLYQLFAIFDANEKNYSEKSIEFFFDQVLMTMYTQINATTIHREALEYFTRNPASALVLNLPFALPVKVPPPIVKRLKELWQRALPAAKNIRSHFEHNLPNLQFQVWQPNSMTPITFFRMRSPEYPANQIDPLYRQFLAHHAAQKTSHLSLIMLSPQVFTPEAVIADKRFQLQKEYTSLTAFRCEPDSDFIAQDANTKKIEEVEEFIQTLSEHLLNESPAFEFSAEVRSSTRFKVQVKQAISLVKELLFPGKLELNTEEKRDFSLMCVVLLLENFCCDLNPLTVDTACRAHIDRGMMISSILYIYLMIKSGKEQDPQFLNYLEVLTLSPALVVEGRPPHQEKMQAVLSLACRLLDPETVERIRGERTFFSECNLTIPAE